MKPKDRIFMKGDLVYRRDSEYYGIVTGFDADNDIYIIDFSGSREYSNNPHLLDWANKYSLLTKKDIDNGSFVPNR
jgi:hypothetical protein